MLRLSYSVSNAGLDNPRHFSSCLSTCDFTGFYTQPTTDENFFFYSIRFVHNLWSKMELSKKFISVGNICKTNISRYVRRLKKKWWAKKPKKKKKGDETNNYFYPQNLGPAPPIIMGRYRHCIPCRLSFRAININCFPWKTIKAKRHIFEITCVFFLMSSVHQFTYITRL